MASIELIGGLSPFRHAVFILCLIVVFAAGCRDSATRTNLRESVSQEKLADARLKTIFDDYCNLLDRVVKSSGQTIRFLDDSEKESGVIKNDYKKGYFVSHFYPEMDASGKQIGGGFVFARNRNYAFELITEREKPKWIIFFMKFIKELTPEEVETAWGPNKPEDYHYIMQGLGNGPVINAAFILSPAVSIADISESGDETTINYSRPNVSGNNQKINGTIRFKKGDNGLPVFASEESEGVSISCSNEYEFSDNMLSGIRSTQTEKNADGQSLTKKLTKIEYARIPHEEFLISKFGFPEPPTQSGNSRWFWWLGVLAVGVVIYFAGRSMSTRQKK